MLLASQLKFKVLAVLLTLALVIPMVMMPVGAAQAQDKIPTNVGMISTEVDVLLKEKYPEIEMVDISGKECPETGGIKVKLKLSDGIEIETQGSPGSIVSSVGGGSRKCEKTLEMIEEIIDEIEDKIILDIETKMHPKWHWPDPPPAGEHWWNVNFNKSDKKSVKDSHIILRQEGTLRKNGYISFTEGIVNGKTRTSWLGSNPYYADKVQLGESWTFNGTGITISIPPGIGFSGFGNTITWNGEKENDWWFRNNYSGIGASGGALASMTKRGAGSHYFGNEAYTIHDSVTVR